MSSPTTESSSQSTESMSQNASASGKTPLQLQIEKYLNFLEYNQPKKSEDNKRRTEELKTTPLFTPRVQEHAESQTDGIYQQYALLAQSLIATDAEHSPVDLQSVPVLLNTDAPWSAFICGMQGSGKSHTLSCMLENCLLNGDQDVITSQQPLSAMLFNYDTHSSGRPCEAVYLASHVKTRVLVSPSNFWKMQRVYGKVKTAKNLEIIPLLIDPRRLNAEQVKRLMAFGETSPLYLQVIDKVLRDMGYEPTSADGFDYADFLDRMRNADLKPIQMEYFDQRKGLLESFMKEGLKPKQEIDIFSKEHISGGKKQLPGQPRSSKKGKKPAKMGGEMILDHFPPDVDIFDVEPGCLTIVDLTAPMLDTDTACILFDICMECYMQDDKTHGRVIALDEAHKFLTDNAGASLFTENLICKIREQRHIGARVIISTQEPTLSPSLLDLCSISIVHRFSSPKWNETLRGHLAGASKDEDAEKSDVKLFNEITSLNVGESLLFSLGAMLTVKLDNGVQTVQKLGRGRLRIKTRARITNDGGRSVMGTQR